MRNVILILFEHLLRAYARQVWWVWSVLRVFAVLQLFESWIVDQGLLQDVKFAFVTCGDWDLNKMSVIRKNTWLYKPFVFLCC